MKVLETERLILRHFTLDDLDAIAAICADPDVTRFLGGPRSREETHFNLKWWLTLYEQYGFGLWATVHKEHDRLIGHCGLRTWGTEGVPWRIEGVRETEVAYTLARAYWGQGLATEAASAVRDYGFGQLGLVRLASPIHAENIASQRVAEKIGMRYERDIVFYGQPRRLYVVEGVG